MKKILLIITLFMSMSGSLWAYDFSVKMPQGYSLYYNIVSDDEDEYEYVEVTYPAVDVMNYWYGHLAPWGQMTIPSEVEYDGVTYTVVSVSDRAFSGCAELTSVTIPATVTNIGAYAFYQCTGLRGEVTIGESVKSIGRSAFYGCSGITAVNFNAVNCELMGGSRSGTVFGNCLKLTKVKFGQRVRRIPDYAFTGMDMLRYEWNLPAALEYVGEFAFAFCYNISGSLRLPKNVRTVKSYAFAQCHNMSSVELSPSLEKVEDRAFFQCVKLQTVRAKSFVPPVLGSDVFQGTSANLTVEVPCISADRYKKTEEWKSVGVMKVAQPCTIELIARVDNPDGGAVIGTGSYRVGDTALLVVACYSGWGFDSWSDGCMDNPRRVVVNDTTTYKALLQKAEIVTEVVEVHDTVYKEGVEVVFEYFEVNDVAEPIDSQDYILYNRSRRRLEVDIPRREMVAFTLYDATGRCLMTGRPRNGRVSMKRYPTGSYIARLTTKTDEIIVRFFYSDQK